MKQVRPGVKIDQAVVYTLQFLEPADVLKLIQVNKSIRKTLFGNMKTFPGYQNLFINRVKYLNQQLDEKLEVIRGHERNIRFLREQDELRVQLMKETPETYIKQIIEKYIVKPKFEKKGVNNSKGKQAK